MALPWASSATRWRRGSSVLHDQVDVELHAVEVLLEEEVVPVRRSRRSRGRRPAHERIDLRQGLEVVHAHAAHRRRAELGFHDGGEPHLGRRGEELVERSDATAPSASAIRAPPRARGSGPCCGPRPTASGGFVGRSSAAATRAATHTLSSQNVSTPSGRTSARSRASRAVRRPGRRRRRRGRAATPGRPLGRSDSDQ